MKIAAPLIALAALALVYAAPVEDGKQVQPMERRGSGALSESYIAAAVSKRHDAPASSFASLKKRADDDNVGVDDNNDDDGNDDGGDDGDEYDEANPLMKRGYDRHHCRRVCYRRCYHDGHGHYKKRADEGEVKASGHNHCRYYCHWNCWDGDHH